MKGLISMVMMLAIVLASTVIVMSTMFLFLSDIEDAQRLNSAKAVMESLSTVINELAYEAVGSARNINIDTDSTFIVSGEKNRTFMEFESRLVEEGTLSKEGDLLIKKGSFVSAYEKDIDSDAQTELVLENDAVLFAVDKAETPAALNISNISVIINKQTGEILNPVIRLYIDGNASSSGTGFTELTQQGENLLSSSIKISMNPGEGADYDAFFTLGAGHDFIQAHVNVSLANTPPVLEPIDSLRIIWSETTWLILDAHDNETAPEDLLYYINASFISSSYYPPFAFYWIPTGYDIGFHYFTANVTDGEFWDFQNFTVNVTSRPTGSPIMIKPPIIIIEPG